MTVALFALMAPQPGTGGGGMSMLLIQIALIGGIFYFLIIRPQGQARKRHAALLAALKKGDQITTAGGIVGKVKEISENRVTIESGTSTLVIERSRIIQVGDVAAPGASGG